nr:MAG TPA: hypothetical protein [Bacteriophage sp.]
MESEISQLSFRKLNSYKRKNRLGVGALSRFDIPEDAYRKPTPIIYHLRDSYASRTGRNFRRVAAGCYFYTQIKED